MNASLVLGAREVDSCDFWTRGDVELLCANPRRIKYYYCFENVQVCALERIEDHESSATRFGLIIIVISETTVTPSMSCTVVIQIAYAAQ